MMCVWSGRSVQSSSSEIARMPRDVAEAKTGFEEREVKKYVTRCWMRSWAWRTSVVGNRGWLVVRQL